MRSFALSALIPLAFGIFASAAPTPNAVGDGGLIVADVDAKILRRGFGGSGSGGETGSGSEGSLIDIDADVDILRRGFGGGGSGGETGSGGEGSLIDIDADIDILRRGFGGGGSGGESGSGGEGSLIDIDADVDILRRGFGGSGSSGESGSGGEGSLIDIDADIDILRREVNSEDALISAKVKAKILRRDGEKTLYSILCGVVSSVDALVEKISNFNSVECTVEILDPILTEVKDILNGAINDVNSLKGFAAGDILKSVDGLLDPTGLAKLLANVIIIVVKLVNLVLSLVSSVVKNDVLSLLVDILCLVGELLTCVLDLVGSVLYGVLDILCPLVEDVLSIFVQLKIQIVIDLFKL